MYRRCSQDPEHTTPNFYFLGCVLKRMAVNNNNGKGRNNRTLGRRVGNAFSVLRNRAGALFRRGRRVTPNNNNRKPAGNVRRSINNTRRPRVSSFGVVTDPRTGVEHPLIRHNGAPNWRNGITASVLYGRPIGPYGSGYYTSQRGFGYY